MSHVSIVGWANRLEWVQVYDELFSDDIILQKHAVDRIAVWKCRMLTRLNGAIECTWLLVSCMIQDKRALADVILSQSEITLRMQYSIAITRFINLMTGESQEKHLFPVHVLAEKLGLPNWMVELRHNATHSMLPSLGILRAATKTALTWLKTEYWEVQLSGIDPTIEQPILTDRKKPAVKKLLNKLEEYMQQQFRNLSRLSDEENCNTARKGERLASLLKSIQRLLAESRVVVRMALLKASLDDGYMILTQKQMEAYNINVNGLVRWVDLELPKVVIDMWVPFVRVVHYANCTSLLLQALVARDSVDDDTSPLRQYQLMAWLALIISSHSQHAVVDGCGMASGSDALCKLYKDSIWRINGRSLMSSVLKQPNHLTGMLLQRLFPIIEPPLSEPQQHHLVQLVNTYTAQEEPSSDEDVEPDKLHTLNFDNDGTLDENWSGCPLGSCVGFPVDHTSLKLPDCVDRLAQMGTGDDWQYSKDSPTNDMGQNVANSVCDNSSIETADGGAMPNSYGNNMEWTLSDLESITKEIKVF